MREDPDQFTLIRSAEIFAAESPAFSSTFHIIVQVLYTLKVLTGPLIQSWNTKAQESLKQLASKGAAADGDEDEDEGHVDEIYERVKPQQREKYIKDMAKFVSWLKDQDEEDEEE